METNEKLSCYSCQKDLDISPGQRIPRSEECPFCYASLHSCKMCKFYDQTVYNECKETSADRIVEKEKPNFCDYFTLGGSGSGGNDAQALLDAANALFK